MNFPGLSEYIEVLKKIYAAEEELRATYTQLRTSPPQSVEDYAALVEKARALAVELQGLYVEVIALAKSGNLKPADIDAALVGYKTKWLYTQPEEVPDVLPGENPPAVIEEYTWYPNPVPTVDALHSAGLLHGTMWSSNDKQFWAITPLGGTVMKNDPNGSKATDAGPF